MADDTRSMFEELMEGLGALEAEREGKLTLRTYKVVRQSLPEVSAEFIKGLREKLQISQGVFAQKLRTNLRTLQRWEQGRSQPNEQAAVLMLLVARYPDTLERLETLAD